MERGGRRFSASKPSFAASTETEVRQSRRGLLSTKTASARAATLAFASASPPLIFNPKLKAEQMMYPDVFSQPLGEPYFPELSSEDRKKKALADQLSAWVCAMAGAQQPKSFGHVMVKLRDITGVGTPEDCMALAGTLQPQT